MKASIFYPFVLLFFQSDKNRNRTSHTHTHIFTDCSWISRKRGVNKFAFALSTFIYEDGEFMKPLSDMHIMFFRIFEFRGKRRRESYTLLLWPNEITLTRVQ